MRTVLSLLAAAMIVLAGCAGSQAGARGAPAPAASAAAAPAARPAPLMHLVFVKLKDPAEAPALVADSDRMLATIPSVTSYFCGTHRGTGRTNIDGDYDVAMGIGFADLAGYEMYVDAPTHVSFVEKWKPRCAWIRIHDVEDTTS